MIYDLAKTFDRKRFTKRITQLWEKSKDSEKYKVEITVKRDNRSISQNSYLHLILSWFATETGYTLEEVKQDIFKRDVCKYFFQYEKNGRILYRSTKDLSTTEMHNAIEKFRNWSSIEGGIYLPEAGEEDFLLHIREQLQYRSYKQLV